MSILGFLGLVGTLVLTWWAFIKPLFTCTFRLDNESSKRLLAAILENPGWKFVINDHHVIEPKTPEIYDAFVYLRGCLFYYSRSERLMTAGWKSKEPLTQITCLRWQKKDLEELFRSKGDDRTVPINLLGPGTSGDSDKLGQLDIDHDNSVFLDPILYTDIESDVRAVVQGVKPKTSMLLYGSPGSGKTQFIKYLAKKYRLPVNVIYFSPDFSNHDIATMFANIPRKCIVLMEDFDTFFNGRECTMKNDQVRFTFDSIINALDGMHNDYKGVVFAMTANDIDRIDDSLKKRPSRFKFVRELTPPSYDIRLKILKDEKLAQESEGMTLDQVFTLSSLRNEL